MFSEKAGKAVTPAKAVRLRRTEIYESGFLFSQETLDPRSLLKACRDKFRNDENGTKRTFYEAIINSYKEAKIDI